MHGLEPLCFCIKMLLDRTVNRLNGQQGVETLSLELTLDTAIEALDAHLSSYNSSQVISHNSEILKRIHRTTLVLGP